MSGRSVALAKAASAGATSDGRTQLTPTARIIIRVSNRLGEVARRVSGRPCGTIGEVPLVSQGHAQPRGNPVLIGQACGAHCDLRQLRLCFDGQQVGTALHQSLDSGTVEGGELLVAEVIVAGVLGAVAQCRA